MDLTNISVNEQSSIRIAGEKVLRFDPFEVNKQSNDADIIFITHDHYDHFQPESIEKVKTDKTYLVAPASIKKKILDSSGIEESRCIFLKAGEETTIEGVKINAVASYNNLKPFHMKPMGYLGYVVDMENVTYFVAGDTDPNKDNKKVSCDVALIPVGGHYTMDSSLAAEYILELKPKAVVPTHYGNVVGTPEDGEKFKKLVEQKNADIQVEIKL